MQSMGNMRYGISGPTKNNPLDPVENLERLVANYIRGAISASGEQATGVELNIYGANNQVNVKVVPPTIGAPTTREGCLAFSDRAGVEVLEEYARSLNFVDRDGIVEGRTLLIEKTGGGAIEFRTILNLDNSITIKPK